MRLLLINQVKKEGFKEVHTDLSTIDKDYMHAHSKSENKSILPQVFVNGEYVGDYDSIEEANEAGELRELLKLPKK